MKKRAWVVALAAAGTALSAYGLYRLKTTAMFKKTALAATASVIYLDDRLHSPDDPIDPWDNVGPHDRYSYRTIVFNTDTGSRVVWQSRFSSTWRINLWGFYHRTLVPDDETIKILYNPDDPQEWRHATFGGLWAWAIAGLAAGVVLLAFAASLELGYPIAQRIVAATTLLAAVFRKGALNPANFRGPEM